MEHLRVVAEVHVEPARMVAGDREDPDWAVARRVHDALKHVEGVVAVHVTTEPPAAAEGGR